MVEVTHQKDSNEKAWLYDVDQERIMRVHERGKKAHSLTALTLIMRSCVDVIEIALLQLDPCIHNHDKLHVIKP